MNQSLQRSVHTTPQGQILIPVGAQLTGGQLAVITTEQWKNREILDPHYAGFEEGFRWQNHFYLEISDPLLRERTEGALDQFVRTPEGQHIIRQAHAMQSFREGVPPFDASAKITITDAKNIEGESVSSFESENAKLHLSRKEIETLEYLGTDEVFYDQSIQSVLFHEMAHAADPLVTDHHKILLRELNENSLFAAVNKLVSSMPDTLAFNEATEALKSVQEKIAGPNEYGAMRLSGLFMEKHYQQVPPILYYMGGFRIEPYAEAMVTQPGLGDDHYFDTIPSPTSTPVVKEPRQR